MTHKHRIEYSSWKQWMREMNEEEINHVQNSKLANIQCYQERRKSLPINQQPARAFIIAYFSTIVLNENGLNSPNKTTGEVNGLQNKFTLSFVLKKISHKQEKLSLCIKISLTNKWKLRTNWNNSSCIS